MRRLVMVLLSSLLVFAVLPSAASARSLTVRTDPNDTPSRPDIGRVSSDLAASGVFLEIRTWDRLRARDVSFSVLMDTRGRPGYDRVIEISGGECVVEKIDNGSLGEFIGRRSARRPGLRDIACRLPTGWFSIRKTVRFVVSSGTFGGSHDDRAPDDRRFVGL